MQKGQLELTLVLPEQGRGAGGLAASTWAEESPCGHTCRDHFRVVSRKRGGQLNLGVLPSEMQLLMPTPSHSSQWCREN